MGRRATGTARGRQTQPERVGRRMSRHASALHLIVNRIRTRSNLSCRFCYSGRSSVTEPTRCTLAIARAESCWHGAAKRHKLRPPPAGKKRRRPLGERRRVQGGNVQVCSGAADAALLRCVKYVRSRSAAIRCHDKHRGVASVPRGARHGRRRSVASGGRGHRTCRIFAEPRLPPCGLVVACVAGRHRTLGPAGLRGHPVPQLGVGPSEISRRPPSAPAVWTGSVIRVSTARPTAQASSADR